MPPLNASSRRKLGLPSVDAAVRRRGTLVLIAAVLVLWTLLASTMVLPARDWTSRLAFNASTSSTPLLIDTLRPELSLRGNPPVAFAHKVVDVSPTEPEPEPVARSKAVAYTPSQADAPQREHLPMNESFYTSDFADSDTSTTIIFNLFKGDPKALEKQLRIATGQKKVQRPVIWVMCFNAPRRREYEEIVERFRARYHKISLTVSDFNYKFHGRFLLAYMARTKYVLIVDDDKSLTPTTVFDFVQLITRQPGLYGNKGHLRAPALSGYKNWPNIGYDLDETPVAEQDYLCGMWFLEQRWLEYFMRERVPSWETSEDMHLSHVLRKYLNLNSYGSTVALAASELPGKNHTATKGSAHELREHIFDHMLGRGNKEAGVEPGIRSLLYAETVEDIARFSSALRACAPLESESESESGRATDSSLCSLAGRTAVLFRGGSDQDVPGMVAAAEALCELTECAYLSVKQKIVHKVKLFNMREAFGQQGGEVPWQTRASDVLLSAVGVLNNVLPSNVFLPPATADAAAALGGHENQRLLYHSVLRLALDVHRNTQVNYKLHDVPREPAFPTGLRVFLWHPNGDSGSGNSVRGSDRRDDNFTLLAPPYATAAG